MVKLDILNLRKALIDFYKDYLNDRKNESLKKYAENVYLQYSGANTLLDEYTARAVTILVDIGFETGLPKISDVEIKKIIETLEKLNKKRAKDNPQK